MAAEGIENQEIAARLRISRPTVQLWRQRFLALRAAGLEKDAPRPGRIPRINGSLHRQWPSTYMDDYVVYQASSPGPD
jgi:hypothetical protein